ncbi:regulatory iron-sulfur-containing complex subunit RicT [Longimicrobium sp.]|jgi:cell fate regulator YaaT (PSP1 superfamily)|uniref:PSP1 domain-containing protein n=1 Tax=Longimicrobium sp. TaxID=2029185 RepID=UPI002F933564
MGLELPVFQPVASPQDQAFLVEVGFKGMRKGFFSCTDPSVRVNDWVLVEVERGHDVGRVRSLGGVAQKKCGDSPVSVVLRHADDEEVRQLYALRADEERVRRETRQRVQEHGLHMKVSDAEWQWDRNKLTIYFTAERRVDFRQLVRDLARTFRSRIELKQIGVRDEAAQLGGVGRCGRQLCCATWLREIKPISLQLAKDQSLSLNPQQISGTCGRLMCCLTYEHDAYLQARKRFPREGKTIRTTVGAERVIAIDIWRSTVTLQDEQRQRRTIDLDQLKEETAATPAGPARMEKPSHPVLPNPAQPQRPPRRPRRQTEQKPE